MPKDERQSNGGFQKVDPRLKDFVDRVIVPALVREYLASQPVPAQMVEGRNCSVKPLDTQTEPKSKQSNAKELLTAAEAAAVLGIKEATLRAWVLKRKISYVKLGRLVRIQHKELKLLIERATVPSQQHG